MIRRLPCGRDAVLVEVDSVAQAHSLADWARGQGVPAADIVVGARTVLFDGVNPDSLALDRWQPESHWTRSADPLQIPTVYDGPDLPAVARHWGCSVDEVVRRHQAIDFVSAFCGFAPGFAYLDGLGSTLSVPRLSTPRASVPAGSIALADTWCGIYPTASPGGWQLIGHTDAVLWDINADPPALLAPGRKVRFVAVDS